MVKHRIDILKHFVQFIFPATLVWAVSCIFTNIGSLFQKIEVHVLWNLRFRSSLLKGLALGKLELWLWTGVESYFFLFLQEDRVSKHFTRLLQRVKSNALSPVCRLHVRLLQHISQLWLAFIIIRLSIQFQVCFKILRLFFKPSNFLWWLVMRDLFFGFQVPKVAPHLFLSLLDFLPKFDVFLFLFVILSNQLSFEPIVAAFQDFHIHVLFFRAAFCWLLDWGRTVIVFDAEFLDVLLIDCLFPLKKAWLSLFGVQSFF